MTETTSILLLKWGTVKGWKRLNQDCVDLLQKYYDLGTSMSAMAQQDTPEQKALLCDVIRLHEGTIQNDWDGQYYTKEQAMDYVMNYPR